MTAADELIVIVVAYRRSMSELAGVLNGLGSAVLIYDNSPEPQVVENAGGVIYRHNPTNPGVSRAYNEGFELARRLGKKFVLLLDQDSTFDDAGWRRMLAAIEVHGDDERIIAPIVASDRLIYSPFREDAFRSHLYRRDEFAWSESYSLNGHGLINSGLVIPLRLVETIGGFNDKIRLDFSDTWFVHRYKRAHTTVRLVDAFLEHSLSGDEGRDAERELGRFATFCEGAREMIRSGTAPARTYRVLVYRTLRLMTKYMSGAPLRIAWRHFVKPKPRAATREANHD